MSAPEKYTLITGGAGFIGTNLADRLLSDGKRVLVYDNLSRVGVEKNLSWLREKHGSRLLIEIADVRDPFSLKRAIKEAGAVFHFAAQVAVTTSIADPVSDFEVNARGTLNLLEALRALNAPPPLIFTSTNKTYGELRDILLKMNTTRYVLDDARLSTFGIGEDRSIELHSPYGCSKGAADQYVLDYARTFGIKAAVFRMSCIYGPHQFGTEDQGWVAHFLISTLEKKLITIYGDGMQVRDVLFVEDLVQAFLLAIKNIDALSGQAFNIGGGPENTTSLLELLDIIEDLHKARPALRFDSWRAGDQRYYVSDIRKFSSLTNWKQKVNFEQGVRTLYTWLLENRVRPELTFTGKDAR
jgi:CDP-paratose 2-epimerase